MPYRRKPIACRYCESVISFPKRKQYHCSLECRFWDKVEKLGPDDCWNWLAGIRGKGYGAFKYKGSVIDAHRMVWILSYSPIPNNLYVLHHCDNPTCVNPSHLFLGTQNDNIADCIQKGRKHPWYGEHNLHAKLTNQQVQEIKLQLTKGIMQKILANKYGVKQSVISNINTGKRWAHSISLMLQ